MSRYAEVHKLTNLRGPGDARPTAIQVVQDEELVGKLTDKIILITGISSGIGLETMRALHTTGAHVYGTVRNLSKGQEVIDGILAEKHAGGGKLDLIEMHLDTLASVRSAAQDFLAKTGGKVNIVIGNAGIMATPYGLTSDGFEQQFATNHLAHFLLFQLLKPALLASATPTFPSRYVSVTSSAHIFSTINFDDINFTHGGYEPWRAYAQSKTGNIWLANSIERKYSREHLHATSVHPGGIPEGSNLARHVDRAALEQMFGDEDTQRTFKSAAQGAATQVWAAVGQEWRDKGGRYLASMAEQKSYKERKGEEGMFDNANEGFAEWVYDPEGEERLWKESLAMVGLEGAE
ncbi:short-chain dehydrogenase [Paraphoma chrysanthemicola]|uniref:Short-chain dehydrogenase n=1 Tax=Paraphoma chrysanthemicola TaxID=798071 RepID=A0A8K0VW30_9PLEO|nr:short-chain dehydrogenase [Paraphoma chrysanthemicola]